METISQHYNTYQCKLYRWLLRSSMEPFKARRATSVHSCFGMANFFVKSNSNLGIVPQLPIINPITAKLSILYFCWKYGIGSHMDFFSMSTASGWSTSVSNLTVGSIMKPRLLLFSIAIILNILDFQIWRAFKIAIQLIH